MRLMLTLMPACASTARYASLVYCDLRSEWNNNSAAGRRASSAIRKAVSISVSSWVAAMAHPINPPGKQIEHDCQVQPSLVGPEGNSFARSLQMWYARGRENRGLGPCGSVPAPRQAFTHAAGAPDTHQYSG